MAEYRGGQYSSHGDHVVDENDLSTDAYHDEFGLGRVVFADGDVVFVGGGSQDASVDDLQDERRRGLRPGHAIPAQRWHEARRADRPAHADQLRFLRNQGDPAGPLCLYQHRRWYQQAVYRRCASQRLLRADRSSTCRDARGVRVVGRSGVDHVQGDAFLPGRHQPDPQ